MLRECGFNGCHILAIESYCLRHEVRPAERRTFPRGRPFIPTSLSDSGLDVEVLQASPAEVALSEVTLSEVALSGVALSAVALSAGTREAPSARNAYTAAVGRA
jgi:hypothetical protein